MKNFYSAASATIKNTLSLVLVIVAASFISLKSFAADSTNVSALKNTLYAEFTGSPSRHSINYMRTFRTGAVMNYSYSIGYGMAGKDFFAPITINAYTTGKSHHLTAGIGFTPYVAHHQKIKVMDLDKQMFVTPGIGYLFQQQHSGLFLRAVVNGQILIDPPSRNFWAMSVNMMKPTATVSVGFSF